MINRGVLALLGIVAIWGPTFVIIKSVVDDAGPFTLTATRFLIAFSILIPLAYREGFRFSLILRPAFLVLGFCGIAGYFGILSLGLVFTSAGNTALIQAGIPAVTAVLAFTFLGERLSRLQTAGIALAILGIVIITMFGPESEDSMPLLGNALVVVSVVGWAFYLVQAKKLAAQYSPLTIATASIGAGVLLLLPVVGGEILLQGAPRFGVEGLLGRLYLSFAGSALALILWNYALRYVNASVAAPYMNLLPVVGLFVAFLAGEPVSAGQISGGAIVVAAVWMCHI